MNSLVQRRGDSVSRPAPNAREGAMPATFSPNQRVHSSNASAVSCVSCGAPTRILISTGVLPSGLPVHRCPSCSLDFLANAPDDRYWDTVGQDAIYDDPSVATERLRFFSRILSMVSRFGVNDFAQASSLKPQPCGARPPAESKRLCATGGLPASDDGGADSPVRHLTALSSAPIESPLPLGEGPGVRVPSHSSHPSHPSHAPMRTLLDIGAGKGEFAALAVDSGFAVSVLEPSPRATEGLTAKGIREVFNCAIEDFAPARQYDCITLLDLLEHTRDPRATLRKAASCLAPGGILAILTPDGASPLRRSALACARACAALSPLLKYQYYPPHFSYVSRRWMEKSAPACGLSVVAVEHPATPRRFLLAKLRHHYHKYPGNRLLASAVSLLWPLARLGLGNKLLVYLRKVR